MSTGREISEFYFPVDSDLVAEFVLLFIYICDIPPVSGRNFDSHTVYTLSRVHCQKFSLGYCETLSSDA